MISKGNYTRQEAVQALEDNQGNVEAALTQLNKAQLKPFLMRIWGPPSREDDNDDANLQSGVTAGITFQHCVQFFLNISKKLTTKIVILKVYIKSYCFLLDLKHIIHNKACFSVDF